MTHYSRPQDFDHSRFGDAVDLNYAVAEMDSDEDMMDDRKSSCRIKEVDFDWDQRRRDGFGCCLKDYDGGDAGGEIVVVGLARTLRFEKRAVVVLDLKVEDSYWRLKGLCCFD